jgi:hypothetical protein
MSVPCNDADCEAPACPQGGLLSPPLISPPNGSEWSCLFRTGSTLRHSQVEGSPGVLAQPSPLQDRATFWLLLLCTGMAALVESRLFSHKVLISHIGFPVLWITLSYMSVTMDRRFPSCELFDFPLHHTAHSAMPIFLTKYCLPVPQEAEFEAPRYHNKQQGGPFLVTHLILRASGRTNTYSSGMVISVSMHWGADFRTSGGNSNVLFIHPTLFTHF